MIFFSLLFSLFLLMLGMNRIRERFFFGAITKHILDVYFFWGPTLLIMFFTLVDLCYMILSMNLFLRGGGEGEGRSLLIEFKPFFYLLMLSFEVSDCINLSKL